MLNHSVRESQVADGYIQALLAGDRQMARSVIEDCMNLGVEPVEILTKLIWPVMEQIQYLYKEDRVSKIGLNLATRLNRMMADQVGMKLEYAQSNKKKVVIACGDDEPEELGGQICADLFEANGWEVRFLGGGVPNDEILPMIGEYRPDLMILFATKPAGVPHVRKLIDYVREMNSNPTMQIMCCGGIYKRADGLAEEIGADLFAPDAADAVRICTDNPMRRASVDQQTVGRSRRNRKPAIRQAPEAEAA
jgi:MerR family transcriptional regulator, light-induced transcriptional regulator